MLRVLRICGLGSNLRGTELALRGHGGIPLSARALLHGTEAGLKVALGALARTVAYVGAADVRLALCGIAHDSWTRIVLCRQLTSRARVGGRGRLQGGGGQDRGG